MQNVIKVEVTRKDLREWYFSVTGCPIAKALRRIFPNEDILVSSRAVLIGDNVYILPNIADRKAKNRSSGNWKGKLLGGFSFELIIKPKE